MDNDEYLPKATGEGLADHVPYVTAEDPAESSTRANENAPSHTLVADSRSVNLASRSAASSADAATTGRSGIRKSERSRTI